MSETLESLLRRITSGESRDPVWLLTGDRVFAESAGQRLAAALADRAGCAVTTHQRPGELAELLGDLRTFALFASGKVALAVESGQLADKSAAAAFIDQASEVLPVIPGADLSHRAREGAVRLLQAIRLFDLDPYGATPEAVLSRLPESAFQGKAGGRRAKKDTERLRGELAPLLAAAAAAGLEGRGDEDASQLAAAVQDGLPPGHHLVLVESTVAAEHPLVKTLQARGAYLALGTVTADRRGAWQGLEGLAAQLAEETGVAVAPNALAELAARTLRKTGDFGEAAAEGASTARLAGEYRKLAALVRGEGRGRVERADVLRAVEDRGQEDVWAILDAIGEGRAAEALDRLARYLASAEDRLAARLSFFALFAGFCRNLTAVKGLMILHRMTRAESQSRTFEERFAPLFKRDLEGRKSPVAELHPFRLFKAQLAAAKKSEPFLAQLPARVLETEFRLKGDSAEPDAALFELVAAVSLGR